MNDEGYFFDTYAFFEVLRDNSNYEKFKNVKIATTIFNIAELNLGLKKEMSVEIADRYTEGFWRFVVDVNLSDTEEAMNFKIKHKELSIPDAIGYVIAKKLGVKFLTGDDDFKGMPNVEFVK